MWSKKMFATLVMSVIMFAIAIIIPFSHADNNQVSFEANITSEVLKFSKTNETAFTTIPANQQLTYLFAVIWPNGYCKLDHQKPCNKVVDMLQEFTIHGLWSRDKTKPKPPPSSQKFDLNLIADLKQEMLRLWPSVQDYYPNGDGKRQGPPENRSIVFWTHEWEAHGPIDPIYKNHFHDYYQHALDLFHELDITNIVINQSGKPGNPQLLRNALAAHNRRSPYLPCDKEWGTETVFLSELHFCLDNTANNFVDCPPKPPKPVTDKRDCNETESFVY